VTVQGNSRRVRSSRPYMCNIEGTSPLKASIGYRSQVTDREHSWHATEDTNGVRIALLGSLELYDLSRAIIPVNQVAQRIILALLSTSVNRPVSTTRLVDAIWQEQSSHRRLKNLHFHVSKTRDLLRLVDATERGPQIVTLPSAYRLDLPQDRYDVGLLIKLARGARSASEAGVYRVAVELYEQATSLWRGPALADIRDHSSELNAEAVRLDELLLSVTEEKIDNYIFSPDSAPDVSEILALLGRFPYRERLRAQLMIILSLQGRRVDALDLYRRYRVELRNDFGVDPCGGLQSVQQLILSAHAFDVKAALANFRANCQ
jgi:SARP family transcriptional regulator, regulator of embCAB operon